ncbi:MAG: hypothetical protein EA361_06410 [Bacteroidetes bacterium]|nr:MAG: hypothetical protein EA361_06410 [Bacteroidota bacterium]
MKSFRYYAIIALILLMPLSSCGPGYKATKAQRQSEKQVAQRRKEGDRTIQRAKDNHLRTQSRETRKRMKQSRKRSERINKQQKAPFYVRWYDAIRRK